MIVFLQTVFVVMILVAMVLLLLGINQLFSGNFDSRKEDIVELREDVEKRKDVITTKSIFSSLVSLRSRYPK